MSIVKKGPCWDPPRSECPVRLPLVLSVPGTELSVEIGSAQGGDDGAMLEVSGMVFVSERSGGFDPNAELLLERLAEMVRRQMMARKAVRDILARKPGVKVLIEVLEKMLKRWASKEEQKAIAALWDDHQSTATIAGS